MPKGIHTVDLDSRRQTGRDSEIAPTNMKKGNLQIPAFHHPAAYGKF